MIFEADLLPNSSDRVSKPSKMQEFDMPFTFRYRIISNYFLTDNRVISVCDVLFILTRNITKQERRLGEGWQ